MNTDRRGRDQLREKNPSWKGGRIKTSRGYILVRMPEHPRASNGYVFEHIVVLEAKLGRALRPGECSHHVNGIKSDNRPENLEPDTQGHHTIRHWTGRHHSLQAKAKIALSKHPGLKGECCPTAKLNGAQVAEIRQLRGMESGRSLSVRFGISHQQVSKIQKGQRWAFV